MPNRNHSYCWIIHHSQTFSSLVYLLYSWRLSWVNTLLYLRLSLLSNFHIIREMLNGWNDNVSSFIVLSILMIHMVTWQGYTRAHIVIATRLGIHDDYWTWGRRCCLVWSSAVFSSLPTVGKVLLSAFPWASVSRYRMCPIFFFNRLVFYHPYFSSLGLCPAKEILGNI